MVDPAGTDLYLDFSGDIEHIQGNFTTGGGITSICAFFSDQITSHGGELTDCDIDYNAGMLRATFDITYTFPEGSTTDLDSLSFDGFNTFYAQVVPEEEEVEITQCASCNEVSLPACQDMYTFTAGLTADTDYVAVMTGRDGTEYTQDVTTDGVGDFSIYTENLPRAFATRENSPVQVVIRSEVNGSDEAITVDTTAYPCTLVYFVVREDVTPVILTMFINNDYGIALTDDSGEELEHE